jgi:hypothetical protein
VPTVVQPDFVVLKQRPKKIGTDQIEFPLQNTSTFVLISCTWVVVLDVAICRNDSCFSKDNQVTSQA